MRAQPNTITAYPVGSSDLARVLWVHSDDVATFIVPTTDREVIHNFELVVSDALRPSQDDILIAYGGDFTSVTVRGRYTTKAAKIDGLLSNFVEHHNLPSRIVWTYGAQR